MRAKSVNKGGYQEVWLLAYPTIISMVLRNLMLLIDTMMIGTLGTAALAGVGLAQLLLATLFYLSKGLADSVLTFTAQYVGAQHDTRCGAIAWQGLYMGGLWGAFILLLIPVAGPLFRLMGPAPEAFLFGTAYLRVALIGESIGAVTLMLMYFLRGLGDTRTPMRVSILGNVVNVVGNYLLIFGHAGLPRLGVVGAALSTTLAEGVELGILVWVFLSHRLHGQVATRRLASPVWPDIARLLKVALPLCLQGLLEVGSFTLFAVMIARLGTVQLALNHILLRLMVFAFLPVQGLASATATLVGQYLGARDRDAAQNSGRCSVHLGLLYTGGVGLLFITAPQTFLRLFTHDAEVLAAGAVLLRLLGLPLAFDAVYWVCSGILKGAGDTRWIMVASAVYNWLVFLPLAFFLGVVVKGDMVGAWLGLAIMLCLQGITFWRRVRRGGWQQLSVLSPQEALEP